MRQKLETEDLVQLANKKIIKLNTNGEVIKEYKSMNECATEENISTYALRKICKDKKLYNGFLYKKIDLEPYYVDAFCDNCGKKFKCQKHRLGHANIFCSKTCEGEYRKKQSELNCRCVICGKKYHVKPSQANTSKYCSTDCFYKSKQISMLGENNHQYGLTGDKNSSWKSDERISFYGYKLIRNLEHPFKNCDGFVFEHRLVAEKYLLTQENSIEINGEMYLKGSYVVHHMDFDRLNNDVANLKVMKLGEHTSLHIKMKNEKDFKEYCSIHNLNFDEVYNNHLYNITHYKYDKKVG